MSKEVLGIPSDIIGNGSPIMRALYEALTRRRRNPDAPDDPTGESAYAPGSGIATDFGTPVRNRPDDTPQDIVIPDGGPDTAPGPVPVARPSNRTAPGASSSGTLVAQMGAAAGPGQASSGPNSVTDTSPRLQQLEDQYNAKYGPNHKPPGTGMKVLGAIGSIFGPTRGIMNEMGRVKAEDRQNLITQMESERNRAEKAREFGIKEEELNQYRQTQEEIRRGARSQAPATMEVDDPAHPGTYKTVQWNPQTRAWEDTPYNKTKIATPTDTFEKEAFKEWSLRPENKGKTMLDFEKEYRPKTYAAPQGPTTSYTPIVNAQGEIVGRWNNRTGMKESLDQPGKVRTGGGVARPTTPAPTSPGAPGVARPAAAPAPVPDAVPGARKSGITGQTKSRADAAHSALPIIDKIEKELEDPEVQKEMGVFAGNWENLKNRTTGSMNPKARQLHADLTSLYSLAGTFHGWRALQVASEFRKAYGDIPADPEELRAGLESMRSTAQSVYNTAYGTGGTAAGGSAGGPAEMFQYKAGDVIPSGKYKGYTVKGYSREGKVQLAPPQKP